MPITTRVFLHDNHEFVDGVPMAALWPEHKSLKAVLALKNTTPRDVWEATYQGNPTAPEGVIFTRSMFSGFRYDAASDSVRSNVVARFVSWDTANKDKSTNAYSVGVVGDLMADYRLYLRDVFRARVQFPDLPPAIETLARRHNRDNRLRAVIIEDKASGTSAYQTLAKSGGDDLRRLLIAFSPQGDKPQRANQAAVWCQNGSVVLPAPGPEVPWLVDFEDELFTFPGSEYADQVDAFSQLVIYLENLLSEGYRARAAASGQTL
jgi:predicted phage terminase large subunit-like protein